MPETAEPPTVDMTKDDEAPKPPKPPRYKIDWRQVNDFAFFLILPFSVSLGSAWGFVEDPQLMIRASGTGPHGTEITNQIIKFDGAWWEHALLSLPWIVTVVAMAVISRALYRIETNMTRHSRPFTDRDSTVLRYAMFMVVAADVAGFALTKVVPLVLPFSDGMSGPEVAMDGTLGSVWVITLLLTMMQMHRIHAAAKHYYEKLETVG